MDLDRLLEPLKTDRERIYVHAKLRGLSDVAAFRAAGGKQKPGPRDWIYAPHVQEVLRACQSISAQETGMTRDTIREMLMQAFHNASTAMEQVAAVRELARLYGLNAPTSVKVQHDHTHSIEDKRKNVRELTTRQLEDLLAIDGEFVEVALKALPQVVHDRGD